MSRRLYVAPPLSTGLCPLTKDQHHYVQTVLRLRKGTMLELFDGQGNVAQAELTTLTRREGALEVEAAQFYPPSNSKAQLSFAVIKNQAMDRMVQKATELGVTELQPLYTEYTQVPSSARNADGELKRRQHLLRVITSAAEQCGQNHLPQLHPSVDLPTYLDRAQAADQLVLDASGEAFPLSFAGAMEDAPNTLLCGPEGGWSERELDFFAQRSLAVHSLGRLILRAETAPLAGLVALHMARRTR